MKTAYLGLLVLASITVNATAQNVVQTSAPRSGGYFVQFGNVAASADARPGLSPAPATPAAASNAVSHPTPEGLPVGLVHYLRNQATRSTVAATASATQPGLAAGVAMPRLAPPAVAPSSAEAVVPTAKPTTPAAERPAATPAARTQAASRADATPRPRLAAAAPWERARAGVGPIAQLSVPPDVNPAFFDGLRMSGPDCDACIDQGIACDDCAIPCPCPCIWQHCTSIRASALYLRPRNADVAYAVPMDGPISGLVNNPIQIGPVGVVDPDFEVGFDVGLDWAIGCMTSITADYRFLDSTTSNQIATSVPYVIRSLVAHPSTTSAAADFLAASASSYLQMNVLDVGMRHLFVGGDVFAVNYSVGTRFGRLEQTFDSRFEDNGTEQVSTDIDFDGAGIRLGVDAQRYSCHSCLRGYGRAQASFLAGRFESRFLQQQSFDPTVVDTGWEAGRVVPILDLELGVGWTSRSGCLKVNVGYTFSSWFNMVKTDDLINAVHFNDFAELSGVLTFDGLVGQVELSF